MASYFHLLIGDLVQDEYEGKPRLRVQVTEVKPREYLINLAKADVSVINQFKVLKGQTAMVPGKEGSMNGRPFLSLEPGELMPLTGAQPISNVHPVKELDPADKPRPTAIPGLGAKP